MILLLMLNWENKEEATIGSMASPSACGLSTRLPIVAFCLWRIE